MLIEPFEVRILGSTGTTYIATFTRTDDALHTTCTCQAGMKRTHCKHRLQLLSGDLSSVVDATDGLTEKLSELLQGTQVQFAIEALQAAELEAQAAESRVKQAKKLLDRVMHR